MYGSTFRTKVSDSFSDILPENAKYWNKITQPRHVDICVESFSRLNAVKEFIDFEHFNFGKLFSSSNILCREAHCLLP
jgi:glutaredoxin 2